jgi:hypothetical protein
MNARLRGGVARIRERDRAELLRADRRRDRHERERDSKLRILLHRCLLYCLRRGARRHQAVDPQIRHDVSVVLAEMVGVADQRLARARLAAAERAVHHLRRLRIVERLVDSSQYAIAPSSALTISALVLRDFLESVFGVRRLLAFRRGAELYEAPATCARIAPKLRTLSTGLKRTCFGITSRIPDLVLAPFHAPRSVWVMGLGRRCRAQRDAQGHDEGDESVCHPRSYAYR